MRGKFLLLTSLLALYACSEEELPAGVYDYQVERLLSGQEGTKTWIQIVNSTDCADSLQLVFDLVENTTDDSLDISIVAGCSLMSSTTIIGRASASKAADRDLFTDSLIFASGDFWIVNGVTSQQLSLSMDNQVVQYVTE